MPLLTFIRHGQTSFNAAWLMGQALPEIPDPGLNAVGVGQARQLKAWLKQHMRVNIVYTSPYARTLETVRHCGLSPLLTRVDSCLGEELVHACDIGSQPNELAKQFGEFDFTWLPPYWWENDNLSERVAQFRRVLMSHTDEGVVVVGHRAFLQKLTGVALENCEVVQLYSHALQHDDGNDATEFSRNHKVIWWPHMQSAGATRENGDSKPCA